MAVALPTLAGSALPAGERRVVSGLRPAATRREAVPAIDPAAIRAFRAVGLAALFAVPLLLTASLVSGYPFAVPAIVAIGYLAVAQALTSGDSRRADRVAFWLMGAFLSWTALACLSGGSAGGVAIALLGPAFAAAPALLRRLIAGRDDPRDEHAANHAGSLAACAPDEAVLLVGTDGMLLASTPAAQALLGAVAPAAGADLAALLPLAGRAALLNALRRPAMHGGAGFELRLGGDGTSRSQAFTATVRQVEPGIVAVRLAAGECPRERGTARAEITARGPVRSPGCSIEAASLDEAITFALRHFPAAPDIECRVARRLDVAADKASLRRILVRLLETAMSPGGHAEGIRIEARPVRGAVLLRVEAPLGTYELPGRDAQRAFVQLQGLVDAAGGTMIAERSGDTRTISLRLPLASEIGITGAV